MISKRQRFQKWRKSEAAKEQKYIDSAELVGEYVQSVENLGRIRADLSHANAIQFDALDRLGARSLGTLLYFRLVVDELLEQLPKDNKDDLYLVLDDLKSTLTGLYEKTKSTSLQDIDGLLSQIDRLLQLDDAFFIDQKQRKDLFFSLFTLLQLVEPSLGRLTWYAAAVSMVVNPEKMKEIKTTVHALLDRIEVKVQSLDNQEARQEAEPEQGFNLIQAHLNQRYLQLLDEEQLELPPPLMLVGTKGASKNFKVIRNLSLIENEMKNVSMDIDTLIDLRAQKEECETQLEVTTQLLQVIENNQQITEPKYFVVLIAENRELFEQFKKYPGDEKKEKFLKQWEKLAKAVEKQAFNQTALKVLSTVTKPLARTFRYLAPQTLQVTVARSFPTLDSECKLMLKDLAVAHRAELSQKISGYNVRITQINDRLFGENQNLKRRILSEPVQTLNGLKHAAQAAENAIQEYKVLLDVVAYNIRSLNNYRAKSEILNEFIQTHNTFWVKLASFLAQFISLFKTDNVLAVAQAKECSRKLDGIMADYQRAVDENMKVINEDPFVDVTVREQLIKRFSTETAPSPGPVGDKEISKRQVRVLIKSLSKIFAPPEPPKAPVAEEHSEETRTITPQKF